MKKIISLILSFVFLFPSLYVDAETKYTFYKVNIDAGYGAMGEKAIVQDGEIFIKADNFANYTRYTFDDDSSLFLVKGQERKKAFKIIRVDREDKTVFVNGNPFKLIDCFEIEGELYLPFCQMLPMLNAEIYDIQNNIVFVSNNTLSLAEILYDFDITDYWFNLSTEFLDKDWLAKAYIVPGYLYDTIVNFKYKRLDVINHAGDYDDYKDTFSEFLSDDSIYIESLAKETDYIGSIVDFYGHTNDVQKKLNSVVDWVEGAGKSTLDRETGGLLLDSLKEYYKSDELQESTYANVSQAWSGGIASLGDCIDLMVYVNTYMSYIKDHRQMLDAVYNVRTKISDDEAERKAAKQVYGLYSDNVFPALVGEVRDKLGEEILKRFIKPVSVYTATAEVAGIIMNQFMPFDAADIAKLPLTSNVVLSAETRFNQCDIITDEETEEKRLSLLLCMIASRKCFEVMGKSFEDDSYYEHKVSQLEKIISALYIVKENVTFDSLEHYEEYCTSNRKKIKESELELSIYKELPEGSIGDLSGIYSFEKSTNMRCNIGSCVATDGKYMYVSDEAILKYGPDGVIVDEFENCFGKIICVDNRLLIAEQDAIYWMDCEGESKEVVLTGSHFMEICYQNETIYCMYRGNEMNAETYLCSIKSDGTDLKKISTGDRFLYANFSKVYFYERESESITIKEYDISSNTTSTLWYLEHPYVVGEDWYDNVSCDGEKFIVAACEDGVFQFDMKGNKRVTIDVAECNGTICCGERIYLLRGEYFDQDKFIYFYSTTRESFSPDYLLPSEPGGVVDVFGDYIFMNSEGLISNMKIIKFSDLDIVN